MLNYLLRPCDGVMCGLLLLGLGIRNFFFIQLLHHKRKYGLTLRN